MWHRAFLLVTDAADLTPFMHEIVCHFGDFIAAHGPMGPFSSEGVEARHQPVKRIGKFRTNRRGAGSGKTSEDNTDIVQTMRRNRVSEYIQGMVPKGKAAKKRGNTDLSDRLSRSIRRNQLPTLREVGFVDEERAHMMLTKSMI